MAGSVERSAFLNNYLTGTKDNVISENLKKSLRDDEKNPQKEQIEENNIFGFASNAGNLFGDMMDYSKISDNVAKTSSSFQQPSSYLSSLSFQKSPNITEQTPATSSSFGGEQRSYLSPESESKSVADDFNNLFISWKSESQQEIHRKLLLANKFLATQCESSQAACEELRLKNITLSEELFQAKIEQNTSKKSQELLLQFDHMKPLTLKEGQNDGVVSRSTDIASAFAPTPEDIARQEASLAEKERKEQELANMSAARERKFALDLAHALETQKTAVHAEAYAEGVAAAEALLRKELASAEKKANDYEKELQVARQELKTERATLALSNMTIEERMANIEQESLEMLKKEEEEKRLIKKKKQEEEEEEEERKTKEEEAIKKAQKAETAAPPRDHMFKTASSLLPPLLIDLQPDSPEFDALLFSALKDATNFNTNAETLLTATRALATSSRAASDAALQVATALGHLQSNHIANIGNSEVVSGDNNGTVRSVTGSVSRGKSLTKSNSLSTNNKENKNTNSNVNRVQSKNPPRDTEFDKCIKVLNSVAINYGEKQQETAEAIELKMIRPLEEFVNTQNVISKQSIEVDNARTSHLKDLEKYLSNKNKKVDRDGFLKKEMISIESRQNFELSRLQLVSSLRSFQSQRYTTTAKQLFTLTKTLQMFDGNAALSTSTSTSSQQNKILTEKNKALSRTKASNMLDDLEKLLESGEIEAALYDLDADWERRSTLLIESLKELQEHAGVGGDVTNTQDPVATANKGKRVPGRKQSFAAKNREQAMTKGQTRGVQNSQELDSLDALLNMNLNGISNLLYKSTVIHEKEGGAGRLDAKSIQAGFLWEKSEKGKSDRRKDWSRYYYKLHPKKGLVRVHSNTLSMSLAADSQKLHEFSDNTSGLGSGDTSNTPMRGQLYSLLSPDARASRSISPRNYRRASTTSNSVSPRRGRHGGPGHNNNDDDDRRRRSQAGGSLERLSDGGGRDGRFQRHSRNHAANGQAQSSQALLARRVVSGNESSLKNDNEDEDGRANRASTGMIEPPINGNKLTKTTSFEGLSSFDKLNLTIDSDNADKHQAPNNNMILTPTKTGGGGGLFDRKQKNGTTGLHQDKYEEIVCSEWALCTVRECDKDEDAVLCFQLISPTMARPIMFQADNEEDFSDWTWAIRDQIQAALDDLKNPPGSKDKNSNQNSDDGFRNLTQDEIGKLLASNPICADCGQRDPEWVSINLGIMLCITCSGVHRSLGTHVSKVRSLTLDKWNDVRLNLMANMGNVKSNTFMEANPLKLNNGTIIDKPNAEPTRSEANIWIQNKYVHLKMIDFNKFPKLEIQKQQQLLKNENEDGWLSTNEVKYDIGKGLIQCAREGNIAHLLFHLALYSMIKMYQKSLINNDDDYDYEELKQYYNVEFELTNKLISEIYIASNECSDVSKSLAIQEALFLNGIEHVAV